MTYQTLEHHDTSQNDKKSQLVSDSQRLSWKNRLTPNDVVFLGKWLSYALLVALPISGCASKDSGENAKGRGNLTKQEAVDSTTKSVHKQIGKASWYGPGFQGKETANGETFDQKDMTAAHPTLPMGTKAKVTNLENGKKVEVRINDRGLYAEDRVIDLSWGCG